MEHLDRTVALPGHPHCLEFERGLSRNTLEAYRGDVPQSGRFLEERDRTPVDADGVDISDFLIRLATGDAEHRPASPATIHRKSSSAVGLRKNPGRPAGL
jgi:site-specific recombinase XerD